MGLQADPTYALETVRYAVEGGAERIILCDTNGGTMPWQYRSYFAEGSPRCVTTHWLSMPITMLKWLYQRGTLPFN